MMPNGINEHKGPKIYNKQGLEAMSHIGNNRAGNVIGASTVYPKIDSQSEDAIARG